MKLSPHHALHLATQAVPILKHLAMTNGTMTLKEFGQALGLTRHAWQPTHRKQIETVLKVVDATCETLEAPRLEFDRVLRHSEGEGHWYQKRWVKTGASK